MAAEEVRVCRRAPVAIKQEQDDDSDAEEPNLGPKKSEGQIIHSGHFMVSSPHSEHTPKKGYDFDTVNMQTCQTYCFGKTSTSHFSIDASLTKLFECMTLAYSSFRTGAPTRVTISVNHLPGSTRFGAFLFSHISVDFKTHQEPVCNRDEERLALINIWADLKCQPCFFKKQCETEQLTCMTPGHDPGRACQCEKGLSKVFTFEEAQKALGPYFPETQLGSRVAHPVKALRLECRMRPIVWRFRVQAIPLPTVGESSQGAVHSWLHSGPADGKLVSPKWKNFKGLKLLWRDKIRLNNAIWRAWYMQYVERRDNPVCHFVTPLDGSVDMEDHRRPEDDEVGAWRANRKGRDTPVPMEQDIDIEMLMSEFTDTLFSTLASHQPVAWPNPREIADAARVPAPPSPPPQTVQPTAVPQNGAGGVTQASFPSAETPKFGFSSTLQSSVITHTASGQSPSLILTTRPQAGPCDASVMPHFQPQPSAPAQTFALPKPVQLKGTRAKPLQKIVPAPTPLVFKNAFIAPASFPGQTSAVIVTPAPLKSEGVSPPSVVLAPTAIGRSRRINHISAEQKRRFNIKIGFDTLNTLVPVLKSQSNSKPISNAATLQKTVEYIAKLQQERAQMQEEAKRLKDEIDTLNTSINIIIKPLFESFNGMVSTTSLDDMCNTTLSWLDEHCPLPVLRPMVLRTLRQLSTTTSILSDPSLLPEQATQAVRRMNNRSGES
ncbi:UNVERIFIED_CONTAM: hypothetical protein FKN15_058645 [Acipenser sinensis]